MVCNGLEWVDCGVGDERIRLKCLAVIRMNGVYKWVGFKFLVVKYVQFNIILLSLFMNDIKYMVSVKENDFQYLNKIEVMRLFRVKLKEKDRSRNILNFFKEVIRFKIIYQGSFYYFFFRI